MCNLCTLQYLSLQCTELVKQSAVSVVIIWAWCHLEKIKCTLHESFVLLLVLLLILQRWHTDIAKVCKPKLAVLFFRHNLGWALWMQILRVWGSCKEKGRLHSPCQRQMLYGWVTREFKKLFLVRASPAVRCLVVHLIPHWTFFTQLCGAIEWIWA